VEHNQPSDTIGLPVQASDQMGAVAHFQRAVRHASQLLTEPSVANLDDCRGRIEQTVIAMHRLQAGLPSGNFKQDATLRRALGCLRADITLLTILLDGAAAFHSGWVRLAASMVAGYTAAGTPGQPELSRSVWLEV
jgi:hypothetical protein